MSLIPAHVKRRLVGYPELEEKFEKCLGHIHNSMLRAIQILPENEARIRLHFYKIMCWQIQDICQGLDGLEESASREAEILSSLGFEA